MKHSKKIAKALLVFLVAVPLQSQVQPRLGVGPFGGETAQRPPLPVPHDLRAFLPTGDFLRVVLRTQMLPGGETWLVYDNGEEGFPEVHLDVVHGGRSIQLFGKAIGGFAGVTPFTIEPGRQALAFAYHFGFDCSDTNFLVFIARNGSYRKAFEHQTTQGRIRIVEGSRVNFLIWSADPLLDPAQSCVWCPHRYRIRSYSWLGSEFSQTGERLTSKFLRPLDVAGKPFVLLRARARLAPSSRP